MRVVIAILVLALLFGCASQNNSATASTSMQANTSVNVSTGNPSTSVSNSSANVKANSEQNYVVIETNMGNITVQLFPDKAPVTVANFLSYVNSGFYNGTIFHRVIPGFMIQGGGFTPDGTQKPTSSPIILESNNGLSNTAGTISMARTSDPNSATSQFFINTVDNPNLDYSSSNDGYTVFGKVVSGMDVVHSIESVQTGTNGYYQDWPVQPVIITGAYAESSPTG